jgi:pantoate--beta-alanine ligase
MLVVRTRAELRDALAAAPRPVGLVPTMGWLHAGHVSLVERARAESATVVMSIFVNPKQFGEAADFQRYPRNEARDLAQAEAAGVDIVFAPTVGEVYPPGFDTTVSVGAIAGPLEGAARPGHFDGVATVVAILFALVGAERAYFGLKDYQQVRVIRRMALDLALPTTVVPCPTVREPDGLALSSRNARLTPAGRAAAPVLHRALLAGAAAIRTGTTEADAVRAVMRDVLAAEPLADPDYVSVADPDTLAELDVVAADALLSLAVRIEGVRLIDNEPVDTATGGSAP